MHSKLCCLLVVSLSVLAPVTYSGDGECRSESDEKTCCPCITSSDVGSCVVAGAITILITLLTFGPWSIVVGALAFLGIGLLVKLGFEDGIVSILHLLTSNGGVTAVWAKVFSWVASSTLRDECCSCPFELKF